MNVSFEDPNLLDLLENGSIESFEGLSFGLVVMDRAGVVVGYNAFESARAGISTERVLGRNFFDSVGPCTNNYLIAQRYHDEPDLDDYLDFVFTLRMAPTPVRLRMLARAGSDRQYLAIMNR